MNMVCLSIYLDLDFIAFLFSSNRMIRVVMTPTNDKLGYLHCKWVALTNEDVASWCSRWPLRSLVRKMFAKGDSVPNPISHMH